MFTRLQVYLLLGCTLLVVGFVALYWFGPSVLYRLRSVSPSVSESREPAVAARNTGSTSRKARPAPTPLPDDYFKLSAKSRNSVKRPQGEQKLEAEIDLNYAHKKSVDGILLTFYGFAMKTFENGKLDYGFELTRDKLVEQTGSRTALRLFDEIPPAQQERMEASFATNFCKVLLDGNQNETGREILSRLGTSIINEGLLNTVRLAHGPFCPGLNSWTGVKRIPMSQGFVVECPIQYTRAPGPGGRITVAGSVSKDEVTSSTPGVTLRQVSCTLSGTEIFDEAAWEYTSGQLTLGYSFQVFEGGTPSGTLQGETVLSLEQVKVVRP
jgi:hypothetical protein